jgi:hypothetical protein
MPTVSLVNYILKDVIPNMKCTECGNTSDFDAIFASSTLEVEYRKGIKPVVLEWTDSGKSVEFTCHNCGSKDIEVDEEFFG